MTDYTAELGRVPEAGISSEANSAASQTCHGCADPSILSDYHEDRVWDVKPCLPHPKYFQYQEINKNEYNKGIHKGLQISPLLYLIWTWSVSQLQSSHSII